jgi:hypothetical protein
MVTSAPPSTMIANEVEFGSHRRQSDREQGYHSTKNRLVAVPLRRGAWNATLALIRFRGHVERPKPAS